MNDDMAPRMVSRSAAAISVGAASLSISAACSGSGEARVHSFCCEGLLQPADLAVRKRKDSGSTVSWEASYNPGKYGGQIRDLVSDVRDFVDEMPVPDMDAVLHSRESFVDVRNGTEKVMGGSEAKCLRAENVLPVMTHVLVNLRGRDFAAFGCEAPRKAARVASMP
jgi:hypothetical protein